MEEGCIVIQTCDRYQQAWKTLFWSMEKFWDFEIPWQIYLCTETVQINLPGSRYSQIKTGKMSNAKMIKKIMGELKQYKYLFYMLEDFWPIKQMSKEKFLGLFEIFKKNDWDSLKVCPYQPKYYKVKNTNFYFGEEKILEFTEDSKWRFSQQASFWKRELLESIVYDAELPDKEKEQSVNTSLSTEIKMDDIFREKHPKAKVYLYNYMWYPVGGAIWRGNLSTIGEQIQFDMNIEELIKSNFP
jgi:hypothetical protein